MFRTMLNQSFAGPEFSLIVAINIVPMKGRMPNVILMNLYFPVRCIDHLRDKSEWKVNVSWREVDTRQIQIPLALRWCPARDGPLDWTFNG